MSERGFERMDNSWQSESNHQINRSSNGEDSYFDPVHLGQASKIKGYEEVYMLQDWPENFLL